MLTSKLQESERNLAETRVHVAQLRDELNSLKHTQLELQQNAAEAIILKTEVQEP